MRNFLMMNEKSEILIMRESLKVSSKPKPQEKHQKTCSLLR